MVGESNISEHDIERRAEKLETDIANESAEADKKAQEQAAAEKAEEERKAAEAAKPKPTEPDKKQPNDPAELRKWATRVSMENAENRRLIETLFAKLSSKKEKPVDWKELAKDPVKLEKAIEQREKEIEEEYKSEYAENMNAATAELTSSLSKLRFHDKENYPRWAELFPTIQNLCKPSPAQPNGDPRVNFNQHPSVVLDDLYDLASKVVESDPNYKKPEAKVGGKSYSQEEFEAAVAKAREEAISEHENALRREEQGAGVGSMGKRSPKGKPGEVNKDALWQMPEADLKRAIQRATSELL